MTGVSGDDIRDAELTAIALVRALLAGDAEAMALLRHGADVDALAGALTAMAAKLVYGVAGDAWPQLLDDWTRQATE